MRTKHCLLLSLLSLLFFFLPHSHSQTLDSPNTTGYTCSPNQSSVSTYPCQTYAFYRTRAAPNFLDLGSIGDLFSVSRLQIANPSNVTFPNATLAPNQPLFVPISCSCNSVAGNLTPNSNASLSYAQFNPSPNTNTSISYANISYTIVSGDTFFQLSTLSFQNLTSYYSVEIVNPDLVPTDLSIGATAYFPIFCKCPNRTQSNFLITYVIQPEDNLTSVASFFGSSTSSIVEVNGNNFDPYTTIFIPVSRLPVLSQTSVVTPVSSNGSDEDKGKVIGLGIGLGICGILLGLLIGLWVYREKKWKKRELARERDEEKLGEKGGKVKGVFGKGVDLNLLAADVSDCLDKYRVFGIEELRAATDGFDEKWVIHGSVYKGYIDGGLHAIKRMKWNACEELKILQKVNHGNLVKLEGFCIDPEDGNCYLVYEYVESGSLSSWLHDEKKDKLSWKTRLRIAIDVANGLQYVHEHTRPRVVHKDIKSSNILLDSSMRAKIANFGLAKSGHNAITMHIVGTQGYLAPEYILDGVVSTKMDVFSFGVVLLELVSGREAIDGEGKLLWKSVEGILEGTEESKETKVRGFMDGVLLRETSSMESVMNVMGLAVACLHRDPSKRPSMVDIVYTLCKSDELFFDVSEDGLSPRQVSAR
jgi:serine/threonine protein kinase